MSVVNDRGVASASASAPAHGGVAAFANATKRDASLLYLDTGVNPWPWPMPALTAGCFNFLPYRCPDLLAAAANYYGVPEDHLLAISGSQAAIQQLPLTVPIGKVLLPQVGYEEHRYRWQQAGHQSVFYRGGEREEIAEAIASEEADYLVLIHPNNPTGATVSADDLYYWRSLLPADGLLIVDQAFVDAEAEFDCAQLAREPGVVILRSIGKFFGLPGLRLGFALAQPTRLASLENTLGPWPVNGAAQWAGRRMLEDVAWQEAMRATLAVRSEQQWDLIAAALRGHYRGVCRRALYVSFEVTPPVGRWLQDCCRVEGLIVRLYESADVAYLRWGLAANSEALAVALQRLARSIEPCELGGAD